MERGEKRKRREGMGGGNEEEGFVNGNGWKVER